MNLLCMTGNIGGDVKVNNVGGTAVANFSVAMTAGFGDKKSTIWLQASLWGKQAESKLVDYLVKGQQVALSGEFSMREYEGKQYPQLRISTIDLVGGKSDGGSQPKPQQSSPKPQPQPQPAPDDGFDDSSIPF
ncbi:Single-stranded DNA-binding protein [compost metagenome]